LKPEQQQGKIVDFVDARTHMGAHVDDTVFTAVWRFWFLHGPEGASVPSRAWPGRRGAPTLIGGSWLLSLRPDPSVDDELG
jgi:hypothetical protein